MSTCAYCGTLIDESNFVRKAGEDFCNNLCRYSYTRSGRKPDVELPQASRVRGDRSKSKGGKPTLISLLAFALTYFLANYFFGGDINKAVTELFTNDLSSKINIQKVCSELNLNLPMMLDAETEIYTTIGFDNKIQYHYRLVNFLVSEVDTNSFMPVIRQNIRNSSCSAKESRKLLDAGITMEYVYHDKNKIEVSRYTLKEVDCIEAGI